LIKNGCLLPIKLGEIMAFSKEEIKQLKQTLVEEVPKVMQPILDNQRKEIILDVKILIQQELRPIKKDRKWIKNKIEKIETMESEDVEATYSDIEFLKKKICELEVKIKKLELARS